MAMTGGTSVLLTTGTPSGWPGPISLYAYWVQQAQDVTTNTTTLSLGIYVTTPKSSWYFGPWTDSKGSYIGTATSGDNCKTFDGSCPEKTAGTYWLAENLTVTVPHNSDGSKTAIIFWKWGVRSTWAGILNPSGSFQVTLTTIPRAASITSVPVSFTDEENPTIYYSNPAGAAVTSLKACISLTGEAADIAYRDIGKTGTSYKFALTDAERTVLRNATTTDPSRKVYFYIATVLSGVTTRVSAPSTLRIVNADPVIAPTIQDSNDTTYALTGDRNKLVRYYSNAAITIGASGQKGATIASTSVTNSGKTLTADGTIDGVTSGVFSFVATDSRGNSESKPVEKTMVDYILISCIMGNSQPTGTGNFTLSVSGNCFKGSFGAVENTLSVHYQYKVSGGSYGSWTAMTVTQSGNTYTATASITGLDYDKVYIFQAQAQDKLSSSTSPERPVTARPVFDWGQNDFNFNVPVTFQNSLSVSGGKLLLDDNDICLSLTGTCQLGSYRCTVFPLCKLSTTANTALESGTLGTFYFRRSNGATAPKFLTICANNDYYNAYRFHISAYGTVTYNSGMTVSSGYGFRTCRFQLDGVWYGGIVFMLNDAEYNRVYFVGVGSNNPIRGIDVYHRRNDGTVLNTEIYNSIGYDYGDWNGDLGFNGKSTNPYPVGSIYIAYNHTSPASLFGGTWTRITGRFLWGAGSSETIGNTAGEVTHTLTADELPSHRHELNSVGITRSTSSNAVEAARSATLSNLFENTHYTAYTGGGAAHNNMPPYINVSIWRRTA